MAAASPVAVNQPQVLRVAAVWGTTVIALRTLYRGQSFLMGDGAGAVLPIPVGVEMSTAPIRASLGGWELDARGSLAGTLTLRGRPEDPTALARTGAAVPVMPGDHGLIQFGQLSIFFQYTPLLLPPSGRIRVDLLAGLALWSSVVLHVGVLGLLRALMTPTPLPRPLELTDPDEYAARFGIHRPMFQPPEPILDTGDDKKTPARASNDRSSGGPRSAANEGAHGARTFREPHLQPSHTRPSVGGLAEVLEGDTGKEIQNTLKSIQTVSQALGGLDASKLVVGGGPGAGLKGGGSGGGGSAGMYGAGPLQTGSGAGRGAGGGAGGTGAGAGGAGGTGATPGETKVGVTTGAAAAKGGLSADQVRRVVVAHMGALRACYETEALKNPSLKGGITVAWQIDPSGGVSSASVIGSNVGNGRLEGCVTRQVKSWKFPASDSPTTVASFPFKFGVGG